MLNFVMVILLCGSGSGTGCAATNVPLVFESKVDCDKAAEEIEKKAGRNMYGSSSVICIQQ